jgi:di/tricarboxylate transporter
MSVSDAAAASFLTPVATPANVLVLGAADYRLSDKWRLGVCMMVLSFAVATF